MIQGSANVHVSFVALVVRVYFQNIHLICKHRLITLVENKIQLHIIKLVSKRFMYFLYVELNKYNLKINNVRVLTHSSVWWRHGIQIKSLNYVEPNTNNVLWHFDKFCSNIAFSCIPITQRICEKYWYFLGFQFCRSYNLFAMPSKLI